jgi:L-ascorbate 6-phosphate lactonase
MRLIEKIKAAKVPAGEVAIFSLAQAGYCFKTTAGKTVWLDPYLSDCGEREVGFRRMIPTLVTPDEIDADIYLASHSHLDHLDYDLLPVLAKRKNTRIVAARDCREFLDKAGISAERIAFLSVGEHITVDGIDVLATFADHGDLAPDAIGFVITIDGIKIYVAGDTAFTPDKVLSTVPLPVDIMIAPINGAFGNLDAREAVEFGKLIRPKLLIASHFGMFVEHGGDPAAFLATAQEQIPEIPALVLAPGEEIQYAVAQGIISRQTYRA